MPLRYTAYRFLWNLIDWVFPPVCGGCGKPGERWCAACQVDTQKIAAPLCPICGQPQSSKNLCNDCRAQLPPYHALRSWGRYDGTLREALKRLKYKNDSGIGEALSKHLIELYNELNWEVDIVVPVPISASRLRKRGYNQAMLLALPLAYAIGKPCRSVLTKKRDTQSQVTLGAQERRQNVMDAFQADTQRTKGNVILLIDDITTTGSTISACSEALCVAGASAVFGLTLARSVLQADADDQPT